MEVELARPDHLVESDNACDEFDLSNGDSDSEVSFKNKIREINIDEGLSNVRFL